MNGLCRSAKIADVTIALSRVDAGSNRALPASKKMRIRHLKQLLAESFAEKLAEPRGTPLFASDVLSWSS